MLAAQASWLPPQPVQNRPEVETFQQAAQSYSRLNTEKMNELLWTRLMGKVHRASKRTAVQLEKVLAIKASWKVHNFLFCGERFKSPAR